MFLTWGARAIEAPLNTTHAKRMYNAFCIAPAAGQQFPMAQICSQYKALDLTMRVRQSDGTDQVVVYVPTEAISGSGGSGPFPPNVSVLVRKISTATGRRGVGRLFVPGLFEGLADEVGNIVSGTLINLQNAYNNFLARLDDPADNNGTESPVVPLLFHYPTSDTVTTTGPNSRTETTTWTGTGPAPSTIIQLQVVQRLATQRRRLR